MSLDELEKLRARFVRELEQKRDTAMDHALKLREILVDVAREIDAIGCNLKDLPMLAGRFRWSAWCLAWAAIGWAERSTRAEEQIEDMDAAIAARVEERDVALAGAARMRAVLEKMMTPCHHEKGCGCFEEVMTETREVLSYDAGRAELERVRRYEEALREVLAMAESGCQSENGANDAMLARIARAALAGKETP